MSAGDLRTTIEAPIVRLQDLDLPAGHSHLATAGPPTLRGHNARSARLASPYVGTVSPDQEAECSGIVGKANNGKAVGELTAVDDSSKPPRLPVTTRTVQQSQQQSAQLMRKGAHSSLR